MMVKERTARLLSAIEADSETDVEFQHSMVKLTLRQ